MSAVYPAFVTWMTKKPSMIVFSRRECMIAGSPRHEMEMHVRLGADKNGIVRGIDLYTLSNTGAYGEHGPTTVGLSGHKSIPLYAKAEAYRFVYDVVYTNHMSSGAYRGYGATQGLFAVESAVNELAARLLLCDEPTGALDYQTGKQILALLQKQSRENGMTVVIITHNSALTAMADRVIRVRSGQITDVRRNKAPVPVESIEW